MNENEVREFLDEMHKYIVDEGGDFKILELHQDGYLKVHIRGKRNKKKSRDSMKCLLEYSLKNKFKDVKWKIEQIDWITKEDEEISEYNRWTNKLKRFFKSKGE